MKIEINGKIWRTKEIEALETGQIRYNKCFGAVIIGCVYDDEGKVRLRRYDLDKRAAKLNTGVLSEISDILAIYHLVLTPKK